MAPTTTPIKPTRALLLRRSADLDEEQARIKRQLADLELSTEASTYSSIDLPRDATRRTFRERCASGSVAGARREGKIWICGRTAWHASRARPAATLRIVPAQAADDDVLFQAALAAADLRETRRRTA